MKNFLVHSDEVKKEMLNSINVESVEDLFKQIPQKLVWANWDLKNL